MNIYIQPQPPPHQCNNNPCIADMVIADMRDRKQFGINKYGTALQSNNGRNMLIDLYQELMDACVYMRGFIDEEFREPTELW